jgi:hypothetical protein
MMMTTNLKTDNAMTDAELDAVTGGFSLAQLKSAVEAVVETVLGHPIHNDDRPPCVGPARR